MATPPTRPSSWSRDCSPAVDGPKIGQGRICRLQDERSGYRAVAVLQALDIDLRELVVYRYYIGHTVPEISAILGIAEGTVKSRLHRALDKLEAALTDQSTRSRVNPVNAGSSDGHAAS